MADGDSGITREMYDDLVKRLEAVEFSTRRMDCFIIRLFGFLFDTDRLNLGINNLRMFFLDPDEAERAVYRELQFMADYSNPDTNKRDMEKVASYLNIANDIGYIKTGKSDLDKCFELWQNMKKPQENDSKRNKRRRKAIRKE